MKEHCKEKVYDSFSWRGRRCARYAKEDGYCKQHHPSAREARTKASKEATDNKWRQEIYSVRARGSKQFVDWIIKAQPELGTKVEALRQEWMASFQIT